MKDSMIEVEWKKNRHFNSSIAYCRKKKRGRVLFFEKKK